MNYTEKIKAAKDRGRTALEAAKAATDPAERDRHLADAKAAVDEAKGLQHDAQIVGEAKSLADEIGTVGGDAGKVGKAGRLGLTGKSAKNIAADLTAKMRPADPYGFQTKALAPSGSAVTGTPLLPEVAELGAPQNTLLDVLPARVAPGESFSALVQTVRDLNAAPVAEGALKPTSTITLEQRTYNLRVHAHVSEPIPFLWLSDNAAVQRFVESEMLRGLREAIEASIVSGNGTEPNLLGVLNTEGVQVQTYTDSVLASVRSAITKLEAAGHNPTLVVLRPEDWEAAETSRASGSGELEVAPDPTQRAVRRLWGVPVVVSVALPAGTGLVLDGSAVEVFTDPAGIGIRWAEVGEDFERNLVRVRVETRVQFVTTQPLGVVRVATAATP